MILGNNPPLLPPSALKNNLAASWSGPTAVGVPLPSAHTTTKTEETASHQLSQSCAVYASPAQLFGRNVPTTIVPPSAHKDSGEMPTAPSAHSVSQNTSTRTQDPLSFPSPYDKKPETKQKIRTIVQRAVQSGTPPAEILRPLNEYVQREFGAPICILYSFSDSAESIEMPLEDCPQLPAGEPIRLVFMDDRPPVPLPQPMSERFIPEDEVPVISLEPSSSRASSTHQSLTDSFLSQACLPLDSSLISLASSGPPGISPASPSFGAESWILPWDPISLLTSSASSVASLCSVDSLAYSDVSDASTPLRPPGRSLTSTSPQAASPRADSSAQNALPSSPTGMPSIMDEPE